MKRKKIRIASFVIALIFVMGIWGLRERSLKQKYNRMVILSEQEALLQVSAYMNELNDSLEKSLYCGSSSMLSSVAAKLWNEASCAKLTLARLGDEDSHLPGTYKFLSQVGDYTLYLSRKAAKGGAVVESEYKMLKKLKNYAQKYAEQADYAVQLLEANSFSFGDHDLEYADKHFETVNFSDLSQDTEKYTENFPTLIYDGPFADNVTNKSSEMLRNESEVTEEIARGKAARLFGTDMGSVSLIGREDGYIPCYLFTDGEKSAAITLKGGYCRYLLSSAYPGEKKTDMDSLIKKGKEYLNKIGYTDMENNYYAEADGVATINFVYCEENGIKCYPDLIKVGITMDKGEIVSLDATQYLLNHHARSYDTDGISADELSEKINSHLKILNRSYAVIPTEGGNELLTVEFFCRSDSDRDALVYIDPTTGNEENILLLTYSDQGILTR